MGISPGREYASVLLIFVPKYRKYDHRLRGSGRSFRAVIHHHQDDDGVNVQNIACKWRYALRHFFIHMQCLISD